VLKLLVDKLEQDKQVVVGEVEEGENNEVGGNSGIAEVSGLGGHEVGHGECGNVGVELGRTWVVVADYNGQKAEMVVN
jgi:hypothetical protein